jgi:hypothetical protein
MRIKCTITHDVVQDFFVFIVKDVEFHVLCEQTDVLLTWSIKILWIDIVLIKNDIHTLADVIIGIQLVQILFHKSFFSEKWLRRLQLNQKLCHIAIDTVKMIHSSNMIDIWMFTLTGRQLPSSLCQRDIDTWSGKDRQRSSCLWSLVGDVQRWHWKSAVFCYTNFGVEVLLKLLENGWHSEQQHHKIPTTKFLRAAKPLEPVLYSEIGSFPRWWCAHERSSHWSLVISNFVYKLVNLTTLLGLQSLFKISSSTV